MKRNNMISCNNKIVCENKLNICRCMIFKRRQSKSRCMNFKRRQSKSVIYVWYLFGINF
jgi:hypothetical protein